MAQPEPKEAPKRALSLRDLIVYGIVIITPIAPVPIYGLGQQLSKGHLILCLALAGVAMMLTAFNYGRMATLYPSAGSAYAYVGRGLSAPIGFIAGWTMTLDYVLVPIVAVIQAALALHRLFPTIAYTLWTSLLVALFTLLNLRGIRTTARANTTLLTVMTVVIGAFFILSVYHVTHSYGVASLLSLGPIYNPDTFDPMSIAAATSFSALTYIGFDGVTTLAEDVQNPTRNVPLATGLVCLLTTIFSCTLVYLAQLVQPDYRSFPDIETAFMDVTRQVGGTLLFQGIGLVIILSSFGAALAAEVAAAKVLMVMGHDNVLPRRPFASSNAQSGVPTTNILIISAATWLGSSSLSLEHAGELLNFGALLGFMGVNLSTLRQFYLLRPIHQRHLYSGLLVPVIGFAFCLAIWLTLPLLAKLIGGAWLLLGIVYYTLYSPQRFRDDYA